MHRTIQDVFKHALIVLSGLALSLVLAISASAQDYGADVRERLQDIVTWDELCELEDCSQFPVGYSTYAIGPELYYFPLYYTLTERPEFWYSGSVRMGRFVEPGLQNDYLRSFQYGGLAINHCCHYLLTFYGLADSFPDFKSEEAGNRMISTQIRISPHNRPARDNRFFRHFRNINSSDEPPLIDTLISPTQLSYNDDFWLLRISDHELPDYRYVELLSKRPLLNDRHVFARCGRGCSIHTIDLADDSETVRAHLSLSTLALTGESLILCSSEDFASECDPSPDIFDDVPRMLEVIENTFEAAQVFPNN